MTEAFQSDYLSYVSSAGIPRLIEAIGEPKFGEYLLNLLHDTCGADHCMVFRTDGDTLAEVAAVSHDGSDTAHRQAGVYFQQQLWRRDPMVEEARDQLALTGTTLSHTDVLVISDRNLSQLVWGRSGVRGRVLMCRRLDQGMVGVSLLRSEHSGLFPDQSLDAIQTLAETLLDRLSTHWIDWRANRFVGGTNLAEHYPEHNVDDFRRFVAAGIRGVRAHPLWHVFDWYRAGPRHRRRNSDDLQEARLCALVDWQPARIAPMVFAPL